MPTEQFPIKSWLTGAVMLTAEIECDPMAHPAIKLGLAVKWAVKSRADLSGAIEYQNRFLSLYIHEADAKKFAPKSCKIRPLYFAPPPDAGVVEGLSRLAGTFDASREFWSGQTVAHAIRKALAQPRAAYDAA